MEDMQLDDENQDDDLMARISLMYKLQYMSENADPSTRILADIFMRKLLSGEL